MTVHLFDINLLIALCDPLHTANDRARDWFDRVGRQEWATCPLTENGFVRIVSQPSYPNPSPSPSVAAGVLQELRAHGRHRFWPDDISLLDGGRVRLERLLTHRQVTDTYLLALAASRGGKLASMDRRLSTDAVVDGAQHLVLI